jgi:hypothetical protein
MSAPTTSLFGDVIARLEEAEQLIHRQQRELERLREANRKAEQEVARYRAMAEARDIAIPAFHKANVARVERSDQHAQEVYRVIKTLIVTVGHNYTALASELTKREVKTPRGGTVWHPMAVKRILDRFE